MRGEINLPLGHVWAVTDMSCSQVTNNNVKGFYQTYVYFVFLVIDFQDFLSFFFFEN